VVVLDRRPRLRVTQTLRGRTYVVGDYARPDELAQDVHLDLADLVEVNHHRLRPVAIAAFLGGGITVAAARQSQAGGEQNGCSGNETVLRTGADGRARHSGAANWTKLRDSSGGGRTVRMP
jgi:hypothetical protein